MYFPEWSYHPSPSGKLFSEPLLKSGEWAPLLTLICSSLPTPVLTDVLAWSWVAGVTVILECPLLQCALLRRSTWFLEIQNSAGLNLVQYF